MSWLVFDIGCLECGEPSAVVGLFDSEDEAMKAAREYEAGARSQWEGQHDVGVFDLANAGEG